MVSWHSICRGGQGGHKLSGWRLTLRATSESLSVGCVENRRSRVGLPHIEIARRPNLNLEVEGQGMRNTREETVDGWFRRWQAAVI